MSNYYYQDATYSPAADRKIFEDICLGLLKQKKQKGREAKAVRQFNTMKEDTTIKPRQESFLALDADGEPLLAYFSHRAQPGKNDGAQQKRGKKGRWKDKRIDNRSRNHGLNGVDVRFDSRHRCLLKSMRQIGMVKLFQWCTQMLAHQFPPELKADKRHATNQNDPFMFYKWSVEELVASGMEDSE